MDPVQLTESDTIPFTSREGSNEPRRGKPGWRRIKLLLGVGSSLILIIIVITVIAVAVKKDDNNHVDAGDKKWGVPATMTAASIQYCASADDADLCTSTVSQGVSNSTPFSLTDLLQFPGKVIEAAKGQVNIILPAVNILISFNATKTAGEVCNETLADSVDSLNKAIELLAAGRMEEAQALLASLRTLNTDCADLLLLSAEISSNGSSAFERAAVSVELLALHLGNALALIAELPLVPGYRKLSVRNRKLFRRRLLAEADGVRRDLNADFVVSSNGSAAFTKIQEAINQAVIKRSTTRDRIVIKVMEGVYIEKVFVPKELWGLTLLGDGADRTKIAWHDFTNPQMTTGLSTSATYSFAVEAVGFLAIDMTFANEAVQSDMVNQAVAVRATLRTGSDAPSDMVMGSATFISCSFNGYQDTLYAHSGWQYYHNCAIRGTVDYVFGNAAAVFEKCTLTSIRTQGTNTVTAQGRTSASEPTGFVFRHCSVDGDSTNQTTFLGQPQPYRRVYLGRPWRPFSRTVFMFTLLGGIDPAGWLEWEGITNHNTAAYFEYKNIGPGANVSARVGWSRELTDAEAVGYTVEWFISGNAWLPNIGVPESTWQ